MKTGRGVLPKSRNEMSYEELLSTLPRRQVTAKEFVEAAVMEDWQWKTIDLVLKHRVKDQPMKVGNEVLIIR